MSSLDRLETWVLVGVYGVFLAGGCASSQNDDGSIEDKQVVADSAIPQTVRLGRGVPVEIDIPANVLPSRVPLTVNVRTNVVRKGAIPVGNAVEFLPAGVMFTSVVRVRQPLPRLPQRRRYAAFQSLPESDTWVRRAPGRNLFRIDGGGDDIWELDADSTGLWVFVQEDETPVPEPTPDAQPPADAAMPADAALPPVDASPLPMPKPASLSVNPTSIDFGNVVFGSQAPAQSVTVTNTGEMPTGSLTVAFPGSAAGGFGARPTSTCAGTDLAPGATCVVQVFAEPTQAVNAMGVLSIASSAGAVVSVSLTVNGIKPPLLMASVPTLMFDAAPIQAIGATLSVTLTNVGDLVTGPLVLTIAGPDAASFVLDQGTCLVPLEKGQSCLARVGVVAAKVGALAATLSATAAPGGAAVVDLVGEGLGEENWAKLVFTEPVVPPGSTQYFNEFPIGGCSTSMIDFTVQNQGEYVSEPITVSFSGPQASDYLLVPGGDTCTGKRLPVGQTCVVRVNVCGSEWGDHRGTLKVGAKASQAASVDMYGYSS